MMAGGAELLRGDCLELLPAMEQESADLILCDLPYGVTRCAWDRPINLQELWRQYVRVLKESGACLLFSMQRLAVQLINSAPRGWFRYEWIWDKRAATGWLEARRRPMVAHEQLLVFAPQRPRYYPQGLRRCAPRTRATRRTEVYGKAVAASAQRLCGYPTSILRYGRERGARPAQKPVALLEYLVRTYTRPGELVLDNAMGLGSTGVAAVQCGRRFVGMEIDPERFETAAARMRCHCG